MYSNGKTTTQLYVLGANLLEILEHWNDINIAIDIQKSMEYLVPYLDDIARQPANSKKSEGKFQRHQAYLNWSKNNFTNWKEIIQVGAFYFEKESLEDFVLEICQVYEKRFSIPYITDVLVEKAVTKLIMDMEHCSYDRATAIAYAKAGEQKTLYWRIWDSFCLPYTQKEKNNTPKLKNYRISLMFTLILL